MLEGIEFRTGTLLELTMKLKEKINNGESLDNLAQIHRSIVTTPFIAEPPSLRIGFGFAKDVEKLHQEGEKSRHN